MEENQLIFQILIKLKYFIDFNYYIIKMHCLVPTLHDPRMGKPQWMELATTAYRLGSNILPLIYAYIFPYAHLQLYIYITCLGSSIGICVFTLYWIYQISDMFLSWEYRSYTSFVNNNTTNRKQTTCTSISPSIVHYAIILGSCTKVS